jgi:hypothetical protein
MMKMKKYAIAGLAAMTLALSIGWHDEQAAGDTRDPNLPSWVTHPCASEGDVNCRWDAGEQGNGQGHSYIVRQFPGSTHEVCVMYIDRRYARSHDYCS